ncbi:hypothetical protein CY34DRAFT_802660, partial [Suillus luteus UH-Slu-Lm8-n1]
MGYRRLTRVHLAEDLQPYFVKDTSYDVIIGHSPSLRGTMALSSSPFFSNTREATIIHP